MKEGSKIGKKIGYCPWIGRICLERIQWEGSIVCLLGNFDVLFVALFVFHHSQSFLPAADFPGQLASEDGDYVDQLGVPMVISHTLGRSDGVVMRDFPLARTQTRARQKKVSRLGCSLTLYFSSARSNGQDGSD